MSEELIRLPIRLAIRQEGKLIVGYFAKQDTMDGAKRVSTISVDILDAYPEVFERWKDLLRFIFENRIQEATGVRPVWGGEEKAPEHEKSGSS